ncbi:MAG: AAA family ATPase [Gammaproteobacteria bacterium]|nr:AAA family ATPase [Gammaproteobacteria bacterium]
MDQHSPPVNTVAPLANVAICVAALERAMTRAHHLPGMVCFSGPSGWGKSTAAAYTANRYRAYYLQCMSAWSKKSFMENLLRELGIKAARTISDMILQAGEELALSGRPLIIDEMQYMADKKAVEIVQDLYEASGGAPMLLIGEEQLPSKLRKWERFHNRMLDWVLAQPADLEDAKALRSLYVKKITIADDLMAKVADEARGSVRRICVNLDRIEQEALAFGTDHMDLAAWGSRQLFTGEAPRRRV